MMIESKEEAVFYTFEAVQERMVEAMLLWKRSPANGLGPSSGSGYATDAPWQLLTKVTRASAGDLALMEMWRIEQDEARLNPEVRLPLSRADMRRRDEASEWLAHVPERDRRLVVLALLSLASGAKGVPWLRLRRALGVQFGAHGLRKRYDRALAGVAQALNARKSA